MIDNRDLHFPNGISLIERICDRRFGIGADGLILIQNHNSLDFQMIYFNADGSQSLCGNGSRCAVNFARQLGIIENETRFKTIAGTYEAFVDESEIVHLKMTDIEPPVSKGQDYFLNNGSPHHITFTQKNDLIDVYSEGKKVRESDAYAPQGTNVNFVEILDESTIHVRTYERGVENETLSCGTGVTASSLAAALNGVKSPVSVQTKGGNLSVKFDRSENDKFVDIWLSGPAKRVYDGEIEL